MSKWQSALTETQKVLGKGKLPRPPVDPQKAIDEINKSWLTFVATRTQMEKHIVEFNNGVAKLKNALKVYADLVTHDDFDLDDKDPNNKKIADQARKMMKDVIDTENKHADKMTSQLDKLNDALTSLDVT